MLVIKRESKSVYFARITKTNDGDENNTENWERKLFKQKKLAI